MGCYKMELGEMNDLYLIYYREQKSYLQHNILHGEYLQIRDNLQKKCIVIGSGTHV